MAAVSSQTVANYFIELAKDRGEQLTPMQVLKLVYLAHGWMLGYTGEPLIKDRIEAWKYGPVIPSLYETIRNSGVVGASPIIHSLIQPDNYALSDDQKTMIERVYNTYKHMDGIQLSALTHQKNTPWYIIYNDGEGAWEKISDTLIKAFYKRRVEANSVGE